MQRYESDTNIRAKNLEVDSTEQDPEYQPEKASGKQTQGQPQQQQQQPLPQSPLKTKTQASVIDKGIRPIFCAIKQMLQDLSKIRLQENQTFLQNEHSLKILYEYQKLVEKISYNFINYIVDYIFSPENEGSVIYTKHLQKRGATLVYLRQLKQHFTYKRRNSLKQLLNQLKLAANINQGKMTYMLQDSDDEGIFDASEDIESEINETISITRAKIKKITTDFDEYSILNNDISKGNQQEFEQKIAVLEQKVKERDQTISDMTTGYLKDISHLKEMVYRKDCSNFDEQQFYEVQYFDSQLNVEPEVLTLLNSKLSNLKEQYERQTRDLVRKVIALDHIQEQLKEQKNLSSALENKEGDLQGLANQMLSVTQSPYEVWKVFSDLRGEHFFVEVIEEQNSEYDINYKMINKIIYDKRVYEKEYIQYKKALDESVYALVQNTLNDIEFIKKNQEYKNQQIQQLLDESNAEIQDKKEMLMNEIQSIMDQRKSIISQQYEEMYQKKVRELQNGQNDQNYMARSLILKWHLISKMLSINQTVKGVEDVKRGIKSLLINTSLKSEFKNSVVAENNQLLEENHKLEMQLEKLQMQKVDLEQQVKKLTKKVQVFLDQKDDGFKTLCAQQYDANHHQNAENLYKKICHQILDQIGLKIKDEEFPELDLDKEKELSSKNFFMKLQELTKQQKRIIRESLIQIQKVEAVQETLDEYDNFSTADKMVMTDIYDLSEPYVGTQAQALVKQQSSSNQSPLAGGQFQPGGQPQKLQQQDEKTGKESGSSKSQQRAPATSDASVQTTGAAIDQLEKLIESQKGSINGLQSELSQIKAQLNQAQGAFEKQLKAKQQQITELKKRYQQLRMEGSKKSSQTSRNRDGGASDMPQSQDGSSKLGNPQSPNTPQMDGQSKTMDLVSKSQFSQFQRSSQNIQSNSNRDESGAQQQLANNLDALANQDSKEEQDNLDPDDPELKIDADDDNTSDEVRCAQTSNIIKRPNYRNRKKVMKKKVFQRLFEDQYEREHKLDELKKEIERLESNHWQSILKMLHHFQSEISQTIGPDGQPVQDFSGLNIINCQKQPPSNTGLNKNLNDKLMPGQPQSSARNASYDSNTLNLRSPTFISRHSLLNVQQSTVRSRADHFYSRKKEPVSPNNTGAKDAPNLDENEIQSIFTQLNQDYYNRRKNYLEKVFDSFRKHSFRLTKKDDSTNKIIKVDPNRAVQTSYNSRRHMKKIYIESLQNSYDINIPEGGPQKKSNYNTQDPQNQCTEQSIDEGYKVNASGTKQRQIKSQANSPRILISSQQFLKNFATSSTARNADKKNPLDMYPGNKKYICINQSLNLKEQPKKGSNNSQSIVDMIRIENQTNRAQNSFTQSNITINTSQINYN